MVLKRQIHTVRRLRCAVAIALLGNASTPLAAREFPSLQQSDLLPIATHVSEAALRFHIPEQWIYAVMRAESAGRVAATSPVGAMGLMQIMPQTWGVLRARYGLGSNAYDPHDNIIAGAAYIRELYDRFGAPGFLGAYNAGPGRYGAHVILGRSLPLETRNYIAKISPALDHDVPTSGSVIVAAGIVPIAPPARVDWSFAALFSRTLKAVQPTRDVDTAMQSEAPSPAHQHIQNRATIVPQNTLFVHVSGSK